MTDNWLFLPYAEYDAATNMAIDEVLLEAHSSGELPPTLRLYGFKPAAVSIGLSQKLGSDAVGRITERGFDIVRRPTGGRAVLHLNDLTYGFVGTAVSKPDGFLSEGVTESYKQICEALILAFAILGVESEIGSTGAPYRHLQDCFMATTGCDLHHRGTKLIGSAQVRRKGVVLQHGSVPLSQDTGVMSELLAETAAVTNRHVNIFDLLNREIATTDFEQAFQSGFQKHFDVQMEAGTLTGEQWQKVNELAVTYRQEFAISQKV